MQPLSLAGVVEIIGQCLSQPSAESIAQVDRLLWDALNQYDENPHLWFYAAAHSNQLGRHALAAQCLKRCYELESNPVVLANLGKTYRMQQDSQKALAVLRQAIHRMPEDADTYGAIAASHVNEGNPKPGIAAGERSLELHDSPEVRFNLGLLYLESGDFARGFDCYSEGKHRWREDRSYHHDPAREPPKLTPDLHNELRGTGKRIVVYGEQGIGDEIMFSTMLDDVRADYHLIFDCHPRLESLHRSARWTFPNMEAPSSPIILPTRKERGDVQERQFDYDVDAKVAMADLCRLYRRSLDDFKDQWERQPLLNPDAYEMRGYRTLLEQTAKGRKIVGLAMRGGTFTTATAARRLSEEAIKLMLSAEDCLFVGLDYEDMTQTAEWAMKEFGSKRYIWNAAINFAWDYHHVAALIAATDVVVSVPQSVAHLSAALHHPTVVLNPVKTAWRECNPYPPEVRQFEPWYWYGPHARMVRQQEEGNWPVVLAMAHADELIEAAKR